MNENLGLCSVRYNAVIDLSLGILWKYCFLWRRLRWIILVGWKDAQGGTWMVRRMRLQPSIQATSSLRSMYSGTVLDQLNCQACRSYSEKSRGRKKVKLPVILQEFLWTAPSAPLPPALPWCGFGVSLGADLDARYDKTEVRVISVGYSGGSAIPADENMIKYARTLFVEHGRRLSWTWNHPRGSHFRTKS